jgi:amidohydrolase
MTEIQTQQMDNRSSFASVLEPNRPSLDQYEEFYKHAHTIAELSTQEKDTAALIASHLKKLSSDLDIRTDIGGHGLIAILRNGSGRTILLRADMDALPLLEKTGLPYASQKTMLNVDGVAKPTMHACGHDLHFTSLLAVAETLMAARESWDGTIVFLFQPAEERGVGASGMIADGLFDPERVACPIPDVLLGQHVFPMSAGTTSVRSGAMMAGADNFRVTIFGSGGHGSGPHFTIDPVLIASHVVVRLQTIVSREIPYDESAVVTVGSIQAGFAENIIPDEAVLLVNVRSASVEWRGKILASVRRIVQAECMAGRCPKDPLIEPTSTFALTINDETVTAAINDSFSAHFGDDHDPNAPFIPGSEDFGVLGAAINKPSCFWFFGGHDRSKYEESLRSKDPLPINHSPFFAPVIQGGQQSTNEQSGREIGRLLTSAGL